MIGRIQVAARGLAAALIVLGSAGARPTLGQDPGRVPQAVGVPIEIEIGVGGKSVSTRQRVELTVTVMAEADLDNVRLLSRASGNVEIIAPIDTMFPRLAKDEQVRLSLPVRFGPGESSVHVDVEAVIAGRRFPFGDRATLNALVRHDRAFVGPDDLSNLKWQALAYDIRMGRLTEEEAAARERELAAVDTVQAVPLEPLPPPNPLHENLAVDVPPVLDTESEVEDPDKDGAATGDTCTNITVQGTVRYLDENGIAHPVFGYQVQIWDEDLFFDDFITNLATSSDGTYSATFDFTDPNGPDIFVRFIPQNSLILVRPLGGGSYENQSGTHDDVCSNQVITENITFAATGDGPVGSVCSGMTWIAVYVRDQLNSGVGLPQIPVEFPGSAGAAFYNGTLINIRRTDRFDWDVFHHEYGHYVMDEFNFENNPGGPHNLGDCLSVVQGSKDLGTRLAWGEGWPTFFGTSGQMELGLGFTQAPRVGDVVYADTIDGFGGFSYSLELNTGAGDDGIGDGEDNEVAVQRVFWDLFDTNSDSRDTLSRDDLPMFNVVRNSGASTFSAAWGLMRASSLIANTQQDLAAGAITVDHVIGPQPISPADGAIVDQSNSTITWAANVGCSAGFAGNSFTLRTYNPVTFAEILSIGTVNTSVTLTVGQLFTLLGGSDFGDVLWAVEGSNTSAPITGPYLGESRSFVIIPECPWDCQSTPDGNVGISDLLAILGQWGGPGSCDFDGGGVGIADLLKLLGHWGSCLLLPACGVVGAGNCCQSGGNGTPFCDDAGCCDAICEIDPFCCDVSWDGLCANEAQDEPLCNCQCGQPETGDCCQDGGNGTPYCDDRDCCNAICAIDPFCCNTSWDGICADEAQAEQLCSCPLKCGHPGAGDCCQVGGNGTPFCDDTDCCDAICAIDPFCCNISWDGICATEAQDEPFLCGCP